MAAAVHPIPSTICFFIHSILIR